MSDAEQPHLRSNGGDSVKLLDYFERLLGDHRLDHESHERAHNREHTDTNKAIEVATKSLDRRLDAMNEFRSALSEAQGTFVRRDMLDGVVKEIDRRLRLIEDQTSNMNGRIIGFSAAFAIGAVVINLAIRLVP